MKARITNNPPPKKNWFDNFDFSIPAKPFASDEEFWKALDDVAQKKQDFETTRQFIHLLKKGYVEERSILILGVEGLYEEGKINQSCLCGDGKKAMLYFTDEKYAVTLNTFSVVAKQPQCLSVYIRDVIDNALDKDEITSLIFNHNSEHEVVIPKLLLSVVFEGVRELLSAAEDR